MIRVLFSLLFFGMSGYPCTCVEAVVSNARTLMSYDAVVFRGAVIERKMLPSRDDMRGRRRYSITFRVEEYWKGSPGRTLVIHGVDPGTDCLGDGGYQVGKEYLVYAYEQKVEDVFLGDQLWYGWKDILPEGSPMLVADTACKPGGEASAVRAALAELGHGRAFPKVRGR